MSVRVLQEVAQSRRSLYVLHKEMPINQNEVVQIVEHALLHTPSSFNSQSTRVLVLFGTEHEALWQIAHDELRKIVPSDKLEVTENKLNLFKSAAGSILFFEDQDEIESLQSQFVNYAASFPVWAEHANAMVQYAVWNTLSAAGVGANLQHYNPLIDKQVAKKWGLPNTWRLRAQLVFGGIGASAGEKTFVPVSEERMKVVGL